MSYSIKAGRAGCATTHGTRAAVRIWRTTAPHRRTGRRTGPSRFPSRALDTARYGACATHRETPPRRRQLLLPAHRHRREISTAAADRACSTPSSSRACRRPVRRAGPSAQPPATERGRGWSSAVAAQRPRSQRARWDELCRAAPHRLARAPSPPAPRSAAASAPPAAAAAASSRIERKGAEESARDLRSWDDRGEGRRRGERARCRAPLSSSMDGVTKPKKEDDGGFEAPPVGAECGPDTNQ
jgi:hypothetical protein